MALDWRKKLVQKLSGLKHHPGNEYDNAQEHGK
jgi:hypothetical protein